jgi:hypothetical protein
MEHVCLAHRAGNTSMGSGIARSHKTIRLPMTRFLALATINRNNRSGVDLFLCPQALVRNGRLRRLHHAFYRFISIFCAYSPVIWRGP